MLKFPDTSIMSSFASRKTCSPYIELKHSKTFVVKTANDLLLSVKICEIAQKCILIKALQDADYKSFRVEQFWHLRSFQ